MLPDTTPAVKPVLFATLYEYDPPVKASDRRVLSVTVATDKTYTFTTFDGYKMTPIHCDREGVYTFPNGVQLAASPLTAALDTLVELLEVTL